MRDAHRRHSAEVTQTGASGFVSRSDICAKCNVCGTCRKIRPSVIGSFRRRHSRNRQLRYRENRPKLTIVL